MNMTENSSNIKLDNATLSMFNDVTTSMTISIIYMFVTAINLVGNGLSMWILIFRTSPKTPSIIFMINLTLTDLSLGTALPFQIAYQLQGYHWNLGPGMCGFLTLVFYTNMYCSILTMMAIGIDRYFGIVWPLEFKGIRKRKSTAIFSCFIMWGLVLTILHPLMTTDLTFDIPKLGITTCFDVLKKNMLPGELAWFFFIFGMVFLLFLFPFCITTFCYVNVICKLASDTESEKKRKAIRLAIAVLFVFTLCFAPNNILLLYHCVLRVFYKQSIYTAYKLSLCFSCLNSCIDPFIYYFASDDFRRKLRVSLGLQSGVSGVSGVSRLSGESVKMVRKESMYSNQCTFEGQERENGKLRPTTSQHKEAE